MPGAVSKDKGAFARLLDTYGDLPPAQADWYNLAQFLALHALNGFSGVVNTGCSCAGVKRYAQQDLV